MTLSFILRLVPSYSPLFYLELVVDTSTRATQPHSLADSNRQQVHRKAYKRALTSFFNRGIDYIEHEVHFDEAKLREMIQRSGRFTVPQIFIGDQHIGGQSDLVEYSSKKRVA